MPIYLDNAATTEIDPRVLDAMMPYLTDHFGNPSSIHKYGQEAHLGLNTARDTIAKILGVENTEVIFTSGATESISTIIKGYARRNNAHGRHIITSTIEHNATLSACKELEEEGFSVTYLRPTEEGIIKVEMVEKVLQDDTFMVSLMYVNNEIGSINPIAEIGALLQSKHIFFHTDAVQAGNYLPLNVKALHVDALTLSGHKFYGPKGVGVLYVSNNFGWQPQVIGTQEFGQRGGTQNVAGIVGLGKALDITTQEQPSRTAHVRELRDYAFERISRFIPNHVVNGSLSDRVANNVNISFPGISGETLLIRLDLDGIAISTGSSCSSEKKDPSHVLLGIGRSEELAQAAIRVTLSYQNTKEEIDEFVTKLAYHVGQIRHMNITY